MQLARGTVTAWLVWFQVVVPSRGSRELSSRRTKNECPVTFIYDLPEFWDEAVPYGEIGSQSVEAIFGGKCKAMTELPNGYNTRQYAAPTIVLWRLLRPRQYAGRCRVTSNASEADIFLVPLYPKPKNATEWESVCEDEKNLDLVSRLTYLSEATAHRHVIIVGKGQINPVLKCDAWWRSPVGLLKRAVRMACGPRSPRLGTRERRPVAIAPGAGRGRPSPPIRETHVEPAGDVPCMCRYSVNVLPPSMAHASSSAKAREGFRTVEPTLPGTDEPWLYGPAVLTNASVADAITPSDTGQHKGASMSLHL